MASLLGVLTYLQGGLLLPLLSEMADTKSSIVQLNGGNFTTWKIQCKMALMKHGLWGIVNQTEDVPDRRNDVAWRKYSDRRDRALATIVLAVDTSQLYLLGSDPNDPVEVWEKLCAQFQKKSWANKLSLRRRLYGLKLKDNEPAQQHIKAMIEIFDELAVIGDPVDEEDRVVHILASLPESFSMLVTALEACPEVPQLEVVTERLLHEESKMKEKIKKVSSSNPFDQDSAALFVGSRQKSGNGPICFHCGESGHVKKFCKEWIKKKKEEEEGKKVPAVANYCHHNSWNQSDSDSEDGECIALISKVTEVTPNDKWVVDSAATSHMCNDRESFYALEELKKPVNVKVGNGEYVKAKVQGKIKVQIKTASKKGRKFELSEVLYVPDMKYNLLSVSKVAKAGKKVEFDTQGCKIIDIESKEIVGSAKKVSNLYFINFTAMKGSQNKNIRNVNKREMRNALKNVRENKFQEEMMRRLNKVEENRAKMMERLATVEEDISYTIKEEKQNQIQEDRKQEDRKQKDRKQEEENHHEVEQVKAKGQEVEKENKHEREGIKEKDHDQENSKNKKPKVGFRGKFDILGKLRRFKLGKR